jgi:hypothetical protein
MDYCFGIIGKPQGLIHFVAVGPNLIVSMKPEAKRGLTQR